MLRDVVREAAEAVQRDSRVDSPPSARFQNCDKNTVCPPSRQIAVQAAGLPGSSTLPVFDSSTVDLHLFHFPLTFVFI